MFNLIQRYKILCLSLILLSSTGETIDCSYNKSDSCIIERETKWNTTMGNITCGSKYSSCRVTCDGPHDYVCSNTYLICPDNDECNECIINCISPFSCKNSIILGNKCKSVEINIGEFHAGNKMQIYAPTNNGSLTINTVNGSSQFMSSYIYSNIETNNIEINCDQNGNVCKNNTVYAESIDGDLDFNCYGYNVDCDYSQIYCPIRNDSLCNIECSQCAHSEIYSLNGFSNLKLSCGKDSVSCYESALYCGTNESQHFLMWMNDSSQWIYKNNENPCQQTQKTIKNNMTQHTQNNNNNENISNGNSENIQISISDLIYFGISIILLLLCCCILIGLFFIYNFFRFKKKQKELEVYVDMTGDIPKIIFPKQVYDEQKYDNNSNIEPVCETPKIHATSIEVLKPPSVTANILPTNVFPAPPPPPTPLKFVKINSASEYVESDHDDNDHDDNETVTTTTDINTVSSNFEINSTASSDLKPHFQPTMGSINIEMAKIEVIDEQQMSDEGVNELSDEGDHESSSDEEMYNKSNNATKGEVTRGNDENDNDQDDNDESIKVISDTITVRESVL